MKATKKKPVTLWDDAGRKVVELGFPGQAGYLAVTTFCKENAFYDFRTTKALAKFLTKEVARIDAIKAANKKGKK